MEFLACDWVWWLDWVDAVENMTRCLIRQSNALVRKSLNSKNSTYKTRSLNRYVMKMVAVMLGY